MLRRSLVVVAFAALIAGCNGGAASAPPFNTGTLVTASPTPTPVPQHLYAGKAITAATGQILQYTLPITSAAQAANFTIAAAAGVSGTGLDANGNLGVGMFNGQIAIYSAPLSGSSVPSATFSLGIGPTPTGQLAFTNAGDLWAATQQNHVYAFTHPFNNASTSSGSISSGVTTAIGAAFDAAQNLYVSNDDTHNNILVWAPPYTGAPTTATSAQPSLGYGKIALGATQLFVTCPGGCAGSRVDVFALPITNASTPAFAITNGVNVPEALAVDTAGNLYVGNAGNSTVTVYAPPFSAASAPTVTLAVAGGGGIFGLAIGK